MRLGCSHNLFAMAKSLDQLRRQLGEVDREILERIALRQKLAREIGQ